MHGAIEDKVVRFADKERHQIFVEPIGRNTDEMYIQGMSSSLPEDVQIAMYRTIPGLENAEFTRPAYAIEYDCINPLSIMESIIKSIKEMDASAEDKKKYLGFIQDTIRKEYNKVLEKEITIWLKQWPCSWACK